jgi:hypothetical protein
MTAAGFPFRLGDPNLHVREIDVGGPHPVGVTRPPRWPRRRQPPRRRPRTRSPAASAPSCERRMVVDNEEGVTVPEWWQAPRRSWWLLTPSPLSRCARQRSVASLPSGTAVPSSAARTPPELTTAVLVVASACGWWALRVAGGCRTQRTTVPRRACVRRSRCGRRLHHGAGSSTERATATRRSGDPGLVRFRTRRRSFGPCCDRVCCGDRVGMLTPVQIPPGPAARSSVARGPGSLVVLGSSRERLALRPRASSNGTTEPPRRGRVPDRPNSLRSSP